MDLLGVRRYESSSSFGTLPIVQPLVELLQILLFFLDLLAKLLPLLCASLLLSLAVSALLLLPPQCDSGLHQSRYKIGDEIFDSLDFSVTPSRSLFVLPPCFRVNYQHQLSCRLLCHDFVVIPAVHRIWYACLLCHNSPNCVFDTDLCVLSADLCPCPASRRCFAADPLSCYCRHY